MIDWKKGLSKDIKLDDDSYVIIDIHAVLSSRPKRLDEMRGVFLIIKQTRNGMVKYFKEKIYCINKQEGSLFYY